MDWNRRLQLLNEMLETQTNMLNHYQEDNDLKMIADYQSRIEHTKKHIQIIKLREF